MMVDINKKGPLLAATLCRCCGVIKKCRLLTCEYSFENTTEIYSELILDCFGIMLSNLEGAASQERGICATCVVQLRGARQFKQRILQCEQLMLERLHDMDNKACGLIKSELVSEDEINDSQIDLNPEENIIEVKLTKEKSIKKKRSKMRPEVAVRAARSLQVRSERRREMKKVLQRNIEELRKYTRAEKNGGPKWQEIEQNLPQHQITQPQHRPVMIDDDFELRHNIVSIVEYSHVTPFRNRIGHYYCCYCRAVYTDVEELRAHTATHNPADFELTLDTKRLTKLDISRIDCRLCPEKIYDLTTLKSHLKIKHKKIIYDIKTRECIPVKLSNSLLQCLECDMTFHFIDKLIQHLSEHYGEYVCDLCGLCYIEETALLQHIRKHNKIKENYPCEVCGKNLKSNYSRNLHIATIHEKRACVQCFKCTESFLTYAQRVRHMINVHGESRRYECKECDKVFDVRKSLVKHLRGHK